MTANPLSWRPVRRGAVYCAPACGLGCKFSDYEKVCRDAARLSEALGPAWQPVVWENLGWFYKSVSGDGDSLLEVHTVPAGNYYWTSIGGHTVEATTPLLLLKRLLKALRDEADVNARRQEVLVSKIHNVKSMVGE